MRVARTVRRDWKFAVSLGWLGLVVIAAIFAPLVAMHDPLRIDLLSKLQQPSWSHWAGTDDLGRDVLSRLIFGSRVSLLAVIVAVSVACAIGLLPGVIAGSRQGLIDAVASRTADALMSMPTLILAIAFVAVFGPSVTSAMIALGLVYAPRIFRLTRSATLSVAAEPYIEVARASGVRGWRLITRYYLPNIAPQLMVQIPILCGFALLAEASLSYLGLAAQPPTPSWGVMLSRAFRDIRTNPALLYAPGLAIAFTAMAFNGVGDGLRRVLHGAATRSQLEVQQ